MAIALRAAGAWAAGAAATFTAAVPAAQVTGDMMLLIVTGKPFNLTYTMSAGWASLGSAASGSTAAGVDTGSMFIEVWYKEATSDTETDPTITETGNTFNVASAAVCVFSKGAGEVWETPAGVTAADETTGTALSFTFGSNPGGTTGDYVLVACGINTDAMGPLTTDLTPSWTGITFGTADAGIEGESTTGGDMAAHYMSRPVSSGTASAAPTATGTGTATGGADRAAAAFVRLRASTPAAAEGYPYIGGGYYP
jgi:hypothetical protein